MSDANKLGLGQIIETEQQRDAIHIAVAPVVAGERLYPGQPVDLRDGKAVASTAGVGVVDPFLKGLGVFEGQRFWLFLTPGSITSLRHEWAHPAFEHAPGTISKAGHVTKSREWITLHAATLGLTYGEIMEHAETWLTRDDYTVQQGSQGWRDGLRANEFWHHFVIVTGTSVEPEKRESFYCCTC